VQHAAIRFCDTKAGAALVVATAAAGTTFQAAVPVLPHLKGGAWWCVAAALGATVIGFVGTALAAMAAVRPRGVGPGHPGGFIFFGDVAALGADGFARQVAEAGAEALADDLARDTWRAAVICRRKYVWVDYTVRAAIGCVLAAAALQAFVVVAAPGR
jgi:hypothetical protein